MFSNSTMNLHILKPKKRWIPIMGMIMLIGVFQIPKSLRTFSNFYSNILPNVDEVNFPITFILEQYIREKNPYITIGAEKDLILIILKESKNLNLPEEEVVKGKKVNPVFFLLALIEVESSFNKYALSNVNAMGYMQIMPSTAAWIQKRENLNIPLNEIYSTENNIILGVKYLNYLSTQFPDLKSICLAYNAGDTNFKKGYYDINYWKKIQNSYIEIENYIKKIIDFKNLKN